MIISLLLLFVMILSVSATFAASDDVIAVDDEITDDVLTVDDGSDELTESNVVTEGNFNDYFDSTGTLDFDGDELTFKGDFSHVGVSAITIACDHPVKFTGDNATFKNVQFLIMQDNVTIDGFNFVTDDTNEHAKLIYIVGIDDVIGNIVLSNNNITYIAPQNDDGYAIFAGAEEAMGSYLISGLQIINNNISYVGNSNGTNFNNVIRVNGDDFEEFETSENIVVEGNTFDIQMPSVNVYYDPFYMESITYAEGIVLYYCDDVRFANNKVNMKYNNVVGSYGSLYVVSIYSTFGATNATIVNNEINGEGHQYIYGIRLSQSNFTIADNKINLSSVENYAAGMSIDGPSIGGNVTNNTITLKAPISTYGIYAWQMYGAIKNVSYENNTIDLDSYLACGMEINQPDPIIVSNNITAKGNFTYGIAASIRAAGDSALIADNIIACEGNNVGWGSGDSILKTGSAGISTLGTATIRGNNISSTSVGIICVDEGEVTLDGNTISVVAVGNWDNYAVKVTEIDDLEMYGNNINFVGTTNGTIVTNGVYIFDTYAEVYENYFNLTIPAADIIYAPVPPYEETVIAEGIVIDYVDNFIFDNNTVNVAYGDLIGYYDTIRAIDVTNSDGVRITENRIYAKGNMYIYAIKLTGENFLINHNQIFASSNYYANGIDIESPSNGAIIDNLIVATAPNSAYPIYAGMNGQDLNIEIAGNEIMGRAYYVVGIEVGGNHVFIDNNEISVEGNHTIGIGAYVNELIVEDSYIYSIASNEGDEFIWDNMGTDTAGIKVVKGHFSIYDNEIETTGDYAAILGDNNGTIYYNKLLSNLGAGNDAIIGLGNVTAYGNPETGNDVLKVILIAEDLTKVEGSSDQFVVKVLDENGKAVANKEIEFIVDGVKYTQTTDLNGVAKFDVNLAKGEYLATTKFAGDYKYGFKSITSNIVVKEKPAPVVVKKATKITAKKATFKAKAKTKKYAITLKAGKAAVKKAKVTLKVKGKTYKATTNAKGKATFKITKLTKKGTFKATIKFAGDKNYKASSKNVKITVK